MLFLYLIKSWHDSQIVSCILVFMPGSLTCLHYKTNHIKLSRYSSSEGSAVQWRTEGGVVNPPPPKFRSFDKAEPNSKFRGIYIRNNVIRIWVSLICKLIGPPD
jgi:hypothetical protein